MMWAVLVGIGVGGPGVAVKSSGEDIGVESTGGPGVAVKFSAEDIGVKSGGGVRVTGVAAGVAQEINTLANRVMTPIFTSRFILILLSR
jgi:hypothetical protein